MACPVCGAAIAHSQRGKRATAKEMALLAKLNDEKGFIPGSEWIKFCAANWWVTWEDITMLICSKSEYQKYTERVAKREAKKAAK